jgi:tRNA(Ile)-lysidine synthase
LKIANDYGVKFVIDSTNEQNDASRNYLRNIVIPEIEKIYPNVISSVCEFGERCGEIYEFIKSFVNPNLIIETPDYLLVKDSVFEEKPFIVREYVKLIFEKLGVCSDIEAKHYKLISELVKAEVNKKLDFPHGLEVKRTYEGLKFYKKSKVKRLEDTYNFVVGEIDFEGYGNIYSSYVKPEDVVYGDGALFVDQGKIRTDAVWRTRRDGDVFAKFGTGSKKLNDYFTDKKVDIDLRDKLPLLCSGNNVLVVAGLDISENVKIDSSTDQIVKLDFKV